MISPYVRRHRLNTELRKIRKEAGLNHTELGKLVGKNRLQISRHENGSSLVDLDLVMEILEKLQIKGERWTQIVDVAREAGERGWWEPNAKIMGPRQALFANLEAGARTIREFAQTIPPGLLQTPDFTRSRVEAAPAPLANGTTPAGILLGRAGRQRVMRRPDGPEYEVILDELAVRRLSAPAPVLRDQLRYLTEAAETEKITIRVLPVDALIAGYDVPVCSFSIYGYADPDDSTVIGIEAVTSDVVLTEPEQAGQVARYAGLFDALGTAAKSAADSHTFLTKAAEALA